VGVGLKPDLQAVAGSGNVQHEAESGLRLQVMLAVVVRSRRMPVPHHSLPLAVSRASSPAVLLATLVTALAVLTGAGAVRDSLADEAPPPPMVSVAEPLVKEVVEWDEFTGRFAPVTEIDVRARVSGYLESLHFREGDLVKKGDLLFVIDPRPFEAAQAETRAQLERARTQLAYAEREYERGKQLGTSRALSQELVDERRAARDAASAELSAAQARARAADLDLGFTRVMSPIDGRISDARVDVGNLISGGNADSTLLTTIVSIDPIELVIEASETEFLKYLRLGRETGRAADGERGTPVEARLMDEATWSHRGEVTFVDNRLDPATGTMRVKATFANPDRILRPGVFARARMVASAPFEAILVPERAVLSDQDRKIVYLVDASNVIKAQTVKLGPRIDGLRVVREGLVAGQRIVVDGLLRARPGSAVTPELITIAGDDPARDNDSAASAIP
jgi:RND family efflux transporter MFP subunit